MSILTILLVSSISINVIAETESNEDIGLKVEELILSIESTIGKEINLDNVLSAEINDQTVIVTIVVMDDGSRTGYTRILEAEANYLYANPVIQTRGIWSIIKTIVDAVKTVFTEVKYTCKVVSIFQEGILVE